MTDISAQLAASCLIAWNSRSHAHVSFFRYPPLSAIASVCGPNPDSLKSLPALAAALGVHSLHIKDEGKREPLPSFKVVGAMWALQRLGESMKRLPVLACATDGNHGAGVAWAAAKYGCHAIVRMPAGTSLERVQRIRSIGAQCTVTDRNYDQTVEDLVRDAEEKGWQIIQDTAWEGYEEIPFWIMEGYTLIAQEIVASWPRAEAPPTHFFLQAGVGSFAAAMIGVLAEKYPNARFILVEPQKAACYYESFRKGNPQIIEGDLSTIMSGLACGRPNPIAWPILAAHCSCCLACADWLAATACRILWGPLGEDPAIIAGESGAASLGGLLWLMCAPEASKARNELELSPNARIVMINTEGATDLKSYRDIVWGGAYPSPPAFPLPSLDRNMGG